MAITRRFRRVAIATFDAQLLAISRLACVTLLHARSFCFNRLAYRPLPEPASISANQIFVLDERFPLCLPRQLVAVAASIFRFEEAPFDSSQLVSEGE